jgi:hypothetical protein
MSIQFEIAEQAALTSFSMSTGGMFSPPAVMMSSLMRPVMRKNPEGPTSIQRKNVSSTVVREWTMNYDTCKSILRILIEFANVAALQEARTVKCFVRLFGIKHVTPSENRRMCLRHFKTTSIIQ